MKKLIQLKLKYLAKLILLKYRPEIIGITGSVGKTSAKTAIFCVLSKTKNVRQSVKNYNNEIGLPLTIIGVESPGKNILAWFALVFKAFKLLIITDPSYPEILILEMGIDRPGDMDYLNSIVKCKIGVATAVGSVHLEYFKNKNELQKEKAKLISSVDKDGWSIVNYDDLETRKMMDVSKARVMNFGFDGGANLRATNFNFSYGDGNYPSQLNGISFKIAYGDASVPVHIPNALGVGMVYSALAATAVGLAYDLNLLEISQSLQAFRSPKGRLNIIPGIKGTIIIDDTYNSEPKSATLAINTFSEIKTKGQGRKLLAMGDMLELGASSAESHKKIGQLIAELKFDQLFVVGERAHGFAHGAKEAGMNEDDIFFFSNSVEAGKFIQERIKSGDYLLVKGSQGMRMEKIVLELMAEPLRAEELLVRQGGEWRDK